MSRELMEICRTHPWYKDGGKLVLDVPHYDEKSNGADQYEIWVGTDSRAAELWRERNDERRKSRLTP